MHRLLMRKQGKAPSLVMGRFVPVVTSPATCGKSCDYMYDRVTILAIFRDSPHEIPD